MTKGSKGAKPPKTPKPAFPGAKPPFKKKGSKG